MACELRVVLETLNTLTIPAVREDVVDHAYARALYPVYYTLRHSYVEAMCW